MSGLLLMKPFGPLQWAKYSSEPPVIDRSILPSVEPLQLILPPLVYWLVAMSKEMGGGSVSVMLELAPQPRASTTVMVYVPATSPVMSSLIVAKPFGPLQMIE